MPQQDEPKFYSKNNVADCKIHGKFYGKLKNPDFYMKISIKYICIV